jgi:secreted PhoX family phosphatase
MKKTAIVFALVAGLGIGLVGSALAGLDFGLDEQNLLNSKPLPLFGVTKPIAASSKASISAATAEADPTALVTLANGLSARVVTAAANAGPNIDMMALWPNDTNPTWLIACNEQGAAQPALQRIRISDGLVETIVASGLVSCDPAHRTPWGTIVFAEENGTSGRLFELIDPLTTTGVAISAATTTPATVTCPPSPPACEGTGNIVERTAVGRLSFEGIGITPNGVMYYGDENRPLNGTPGGAYFKFIPACAPTATCPVGSLPGANNEAKLAASPFASAGTIYGLRLGKRSGNTDYGQGTQTGRGTWIPEAGAAPINLRGAVASQFLTGYYRPEDLEFDFEAIANGDVRFCANNTGNEGDDRNYGETICVTDGTLAQAANTATLSIPEVQYSVVGNPQFAMMDNIAYQPGRGNWVIHEDGDQLQGNNDLFDCLPDGADDNLLSDGCVRIGTENDLSAEWTGGVFDATGTRFFVSVQHNVTEHGVVLEITGWK